MFFDFVVDPNLILLFVNVLVLVVVKVMFIAGSDDSHLSVFCIFLSLMIGHYRLFICYCDVSS